MCGGDDTTSTSTSSGSASASVTFNPTISIAGNAGEPAPDTASTFAATLLAAPPVRVQLPTPARLPEQPATKEDPNRKLLIFVAVALAARRMLRG